MQIVKDSAPTMLGLVIGPDEWRLQLNKQERVTLLKAIAIREEACDKLREFMGNDRFEESSYCSMWIDELLDDDLSLDFDYSRMDV